MPGSVCVYSPGLLRLALKHVTYCIYALPETSASTSGNFAAYSSVWCRPHEYCVRRMEDSLNSAIYKTSKLRRILCFSILARIWLAWGCGSRSRRRLCCIAISIRGRREYPFVGHSNQEVQSSCRKGGWAMW